jgi:hypothetical protein
MHTDPKAKEEISRAVAKIQGGVLAVVCGLIGGVGPFYHDGLASSRRRTPGWLPSSVTLKLFHRVFGYMARQCHRIVVWGLDRGCTGLDHRVHL